jgi:hypothetical protein
MQKFTKTNFCITLRMKFHRKISQYKQISQYKPTPYAKKISPSDKGKKSLGEGVAEKKHRNQACLVCFFEARGRLSPTKKTNYCITTLSLMQHNCIDKYLDF